MSLFDKLKQLQEDNVRLTKENKKLKEDNIFLTKISKEYMKKENIVEVTEFTELYKDELEEENKKLKEFKKKRKKSMFYFKAQIERAEPKTAREAKDLQRAKEIFEKLYREELNGLEEENETLKDNVEFLHSCLDDRDKSIALMQKQEYPFGPVKTISEPTNGR